MGNWYLYQHQDLTAVVSQRQGEIKLGEKVQFASSSALYESIQVNSAKYVVLGISESIGVQLNGGIAGTETAWPFFLKAFLNTQANSFIQPESIWVLGFYENIKDSIVIQDEEVSVVLKIIFDSGSIPIVIGGGHNNAYPLLKGLSLSQNEAINVINIDPHADMRAMDQRHSGNGFSYARANNFLSKYAMLGLHQAYNNQFIIDTLAEEYYFLPLWWETIFLEQNISWEIAVQQAVGFVKGRQFGLELDIDAIEGALSSALTPVGISAQQATYALFKIAQNENVAYLHLPEGIAQRIDGLEQNTIGKLLSYLVLAFIKGHQKTT